MDTIYYTVARNYKWEQKIERSLFIGHASSVDSSEEAQAFVSRIREEHAQATHNCFAYQVGLGQHPLTYFNDHGEPSGTAGRPILGQINSYGLTNVLIIVIRYFGGTLLGTSGLIKAYKEAAEDAVKNAEIVEKTVDRALTVRFEYVLLNDVMRTLKQFEEVSWEQNFKESCTMKLRIRKSEFQRLHDSLSQIYGVKIEKE